MSQARKRLLQAAAVAALAGGAWALHAGLVRIPEAWNPWAPLRLDAPPDLLTRFKLSRASADRDRCRAALAQADMRLTPVEDRETGAGCGFDNAWRVRRTSVRVGEAFVLSCRTALSLALWERHVLQQAAARQLDARVVAIEHYGSYACRDVAGRQDRRRSQHARADALDIAGFVLDDGRRVRVRHDWATGTPEDASPQAAPARFLREVRDGACAHFDAVLGPDYNTAHADHFHFDRGPARICR